MDVRERNIAVLKHLLIYNEFMFEVKRQCGSESQDYVRNWIYNEVLTKKKLSSIIDSGISWYRSRMGHEYWRNICENFEYAQHALANKGKEETYENIISEYGK